MIPKLRVFALLLTALPLTMLCGADVRGIFAQNRSYVSAREAAADCGFIPVRGSGGLVFSDRGIRLRLVPEKRHMYYGGIKIFQSFAPFRRNGVTYVSRADFNKVFRPLSAPKTGVKRHPVRTITLDFGHGGNDKGASGRFLHEKNITLRLGSRVAEILRSSGYRVRPTRTSDVFVALGVRSLIQRNTRSDLFVSIHVNSAVNRSLSGIETYALTPAGCPSDGSSRALGSSYRGNRFDANNLFLAYSMQRALLLRTRAVDRGIKRARFAVLKEIDAPGVLVEVGFISNSVEERRLGDPAYREKIARGIADGIIAYHRGISR